MATALEWAEGEPSDSPAPWRDELREIEPGAALEDLEQLPNEVEEPVREIEKIAANTIGN